MHLKTPDVLAITFSYVVVMSPSFACGDWEGREGGREPMAMWARLGCYSVPSPSSLGCGFSRRKIKCTTEAALLCSLSSSGKFPGPVLQTLSLSCHCLCSPVLQEECSFKQQTAEPSRAPWRQCGKSHGDGGEPEPVPSWGKPSREHPSQTGDTKHSRAQLSPAVEIRRHNTDYSSFWEICPSFLSLSCAWGLRTPSEESICHLVSVSAAKHTELRWQSSFVHKTPSLWHTFAISIVLFFCLSYCVAVCFPRIVISTHICLCPTLIGTGVGGTGTGYLEFNSQLFLSHHTMQNSKLKGSGDKNKLQMCT